MTVDIHKHVSLFLLRSNLSDTESRITKKENQTKRKKKEYRLCTLLIEKHKLEISNVVYCLV